MTKQVAVFHDATIQFTYNCFKLNKECTVAITFDDVSFESYPCDFCGEHRKIYAYVHCQCGEYHAVIIKGDSHF